MIIDSSNYLLKKARSRYSQTALAEELGVNPRTVSRWEKGQVPCPPLLTKALERLLDLPFDTNPATGVFSFIDLFAGIGGIRIGFDELGGTCVFSSEWNNHSQNTYSTNFRSSESIAGDITQVEADLIPKHDVLLAGFPCQPFSIAGISKKNALGRPCGFECTTQGTLFFDVARIIAVKRPKAFLLENVKNLLTHDKGNTFRVIYQTLKDQLGYDVHYKVIDGKRFVPQHRERLIIVGFDRQVPFSWEDMRYPEEQPLLKSILHPEDGSEQADDIYTTGPLAKVQPKYTLSNNLWKYLQDYAAKHKAAGNGFGYGLVTPDMTSRTLSARYYKDGSEILVDQGQKKNPRRLTPRECARLMGFPDSFIIPVSDMQAYKQFSQSSVVPLIKAIAQLMIPVIMKNETGTTNKEKIS
jgi:DNA (cytosine-5)-methyltransferase 1